MATISAQGTSNQLLKYKTWVLKVSIHCEGCKRKVKKILHKINGVYTISIDSQQQRVTVTGNVDIETLIKRLIKTGKHAELWPENLAGEEKKLAGKSKNNAKENDPQRTRNINSTNNYNNNNNNNNNIKAKKMEAEAQLSNTTTSVMSEAEKSKENEESQRSKEVKKKKRQGQKGNFSAGTGSQANHDQGTNTNQGVSINHPHYYNNYYYNYPHDYYYNNIWPSSMVYANRSYAPPHPSKTPAQYFYAPSWLYTCPSGYKEVCDHGSFDMFSDDNANGCFIM